MLEANNGRQHAFEKYVLSDPIEYASEIPELNKDKFAISRHQVTFKKICCLP